MESATRRDTELMPRSYRQREGTLAVAYSIECNEYITCRGFGIARGHEKGLPLTGRGRQPASHFQREAERSFPASRAALRWDTAIAEQPRLPHARMRALVSAARAPASRRAHTPHPRQQPAPRAAMRRRAVYQRSERVTGTIAQSARNRL